MKKVILILILFLSCYYIYNITVDKKKYYLTIGDSLSKGVDSIGIMTYGYNDIVRDYLKNNNLLKKYNDTFTSSDYRIVDVIKILEYNERKNNESLNYLIKKADIITISLGMNDLYYRLNNNTQNIYTYSDNMVNNYSKLLEYINAFHHQNVFILGYYNITEKNNDIFNYTNYKLKELCKKYNYEFINLSDYFNNNPKYFNSKESFVPNFSGYEKISQIIIEKIKNTWYNILRNFITMTFCHGGRREKWKKTFIQIM